MSKGRVEVEIDLNTLDRDEVFAWIRDQYSPEDIFGKEPLVEWVKENIDDPDQLFSFETLEEWALNNAFVSADLIPDS